MMLLLDYWYQFKLQLDAFSPQNPPSLDSLKASSSDFKGNLL